jgi:hypothetical protein
MKGVVMTDIRQMLSLARTALDDPEVIPKADYAEYMDAVESELDVYGSVQGPSVPARYAIDQIDQAMAMIDTELRPVLALRTICMLIRDIAGEDPPDDDEADNLIRIMHGAVESLWWVSGKLEESGHE